jgi:hypothetical protein
VHLRKFERDGILHPAPFLMSRMGLLALPVWQHASSHCSIVSSALREGQYHVSKAS